MYNYIYLCKYIYIYSYIYTYMHIYVYVYQGGLKKCFFKYSCFTTLICDIRYKNNMNKILFNQQFIQRQLNKVKVFTFMIFKRYAGNSIIVVQLYKLTRSQYLFRQLRIFCTMLLHRLQKKLFSILHQLFNASINMVMSVTHHFMQSFNDLNNGTFFLAWKQETFCFR